MSENGQNETADSGMMGIVWNLDREACYRALQTRDVRFDGLLFVGVRTTGIYCRPICPARTPKFEHCRFFGSAATAQQAGFRPCLRCRPELSPDVAAWRGTSNTVSRALDLIAEGALDGDEGSIETLANRVGVGARQLRRLFLEHVGVPPVTVAQTRRVLFAKQLIHQTQLPMTEVAMAAGFGSVRRFNAIFQELFGRPPKELRRKRAAVNTRAAPIRLSIGYRAPYDWEALLRFLSARAIPGVEVVEEKRYLRTFEYEGQFGTIEVTNHAERNQLNVAIRFSNVCALPLLARRVGRVFDTRADIQTVTAHLSKDPLLARLVVVRPGLRVPGGWDGFELAVRAMLGQQITVQAARVLAGRLVALYGARIGDVSHHPRLTHAFPSARAIAEADLTSFGIPRLRAAALSGLAAAAVADPGLFDRSQSLEQAIAKLRTLPGVGEWTAQYIALRALRETDAFPASDLSLLRGMGTGTSERAKPEELLRRAEAWRPWRAYAAQHLWARDEAATRARGKEKAITDGKQAVLSSGHDVDAHRSYANCL